MVDQVNDPTSASKGCWAGQVIDNAVPKNLENPQHNNFVTICSFIPVDGVIYRRETNFYALYAVVLDDIGTKIDIDDITIPPHCDCANQRHERRGGEFPVLARPVGTFKGFQERKGVDRGT